MNSKQSIPYYQLGRTISALAPSAASGVAKPMVNRPIGNPFQSTRQVNLPEVTVYPDKSPEVTYDGGMLPDVTVHGKDQSVYNGGELPEVTVTPKAAPNWRKAATPLMRGPVNPIERGASVAGLAGAAGVSSLLEMYKRTPQRDLVPTKSAGGYVGNSDMLGDGLQYDRNSSRNNKISKIYNPAELLRDSTSYENPTDSILPGFKKPSTGGMLPSYEGIENLPYYPERDKGGMWQGPYVPANEDPRSKIQPLPYYPTKQDSTAKVIPYQGRPLLQRKGGKLVEVWVR